MTILKREFCRKRKNRLKVGLFGNIFDYLQEKYPLKSQKEIKITIIIEGKN